MFINRIEICFCWIYRGRSVLKQQYKRSSFNEQKINIRLCEPAEQQFSNFSQKCRNICILKYSFDEYLSIIFKQWDANTVQ